MTANAVILYEPHSFDADQKLVKGRHVAGASFLEGFVRHAEIEAVYGTPFSRDAPEHFKSAVRAAVSRRSAPGLPEPVVVPHGDADGLARVGTLFNPDPNLPAHASRRRYRGQRAYSLCGVTHTICSQGVMDAIGDYLTAPVQRWDALICTSTSVRRAVTRMLDLQADYLEQRVGARPDPLIELPVIPLGVDAERFAMLGTDSERRARLRQRLGISDDAVVVLFFGRLTMHAKAHPEPMLRAMQAAAEVLRSDPSAPPLHFLFVGQFVNEWMEAGFLELPPACCPDVTVHFVDGADRAHADASWAAADLFMSLSDNIQESFGITPIEAMAAGLPCVVSDWDGYRDTVVDGETGIRVPTTIPVAGSGVPLARAHDQGPVSYDRYIGYASQVTAVSVEATGRAVARLAADPELRARMGAAGRARARAEYDWGRIVPQYQALWGELAARRERSGEVAPPDWRAVNPMRADPFVVFEAHASRVADLDSRFVVRQPGRAGETLTFRTSNFAFGGMLDQTCIEAVVATLANRVGQALSARDCLQIRPELEAGAVMRAMMWLAKYGVVEWVEDAR